MSVAGTTSEYFLAAVRLIANGCQQAFEAAELPGLLLALTKARTLPLCIALDLQQQGVSTPPLPPAQTPGGGLSWAGA